MKKVLYILIFFGLTAVATAQDSYMSWQYSMGFASGKLNEYIGQASFRGATYNYSKVVNGGVALGLEIGWNTFYEHKSYGTYSRNGFDYSGQQWRYSNNVPLLVTVGYYMNPDSQLSPFGSLGIGTMYAENRTSMGTWDFYQDGWPFVLKPEVGVMFNTGSGLNFALSAKYYYGFECRELDNPQSYFALNFGFVFTR